MGGLPPPPMAATDPSSPPANAHLLRVGTWNVSGWTPEKLSVISRLGVQLLAVQETHLSIAGLESARFYIHGQGWSLHHGHPAPTPLGRVHGVRCGVGVLAAPGFAVNPLYPRGSPWARLNQQARLTAVEIPPRRDLPRGLRIFSIYVPLEQDPELKAFQQALMNLVADMDMQVPTMLLGDFNGSVDPMRDYRRGADRRASPLLTSLLDPLGPFLDLQLEVSPHLWGYTFHSSRVDGAALSRIDLVLGNRAAVGLVERVHVACGVLDVEHMPVLVDLRQAHLALPWTSPRPRLPSLLQLTATDLCKSKQWSDLVAQWQCSRAYTALVGLPPSASAQALSSALSTALEGLVDLAGGWQCRSTTPRAAYDSTVIRQLRRSLRLLGEARACMQRDLLAARPGCFSHPLQTSLQQLRKRRLLPPSGPLPTLLLWADQSIRAHRAELTAARTALRRDRESRWSDSLPSTWAEHPGKLYSFLRETPRPLGSIPILAVSGMQCTTISEVDEACTNYWRDGVWCRHATVDSVERWRAFMASSFYKHLPRVQWPHLPWTLERVQATLRSMRSASAPGLRGIPLSV